MSLKSGWLVSALMFACLAGASSADEPTMGVVTFGTAASDPAPGGSLEGANASCGDAPGRFGSWFWDWTKECGARNGLPFKLGCWCGKPACVPYLPEGDYGYHETCWRPWTFPRQCPRCTAPQSGFAVGQTAAPTVELAAPVAGSPVPHATLSPPKLEGNPSPYR